MKLYSPVEITKRIKGLDARQITGIATSGVLVPAKQTPGQGSSRLYNKKNILQIMVAAAVRGMLPIKQTKMLINYATQANKKWVFFQKGVEPNPYLLHASDESISTLPVIPTDNPAYSVINFEMNSPQAFMAFSIDIGSMKDFINKNF